MGINRIILLATFRTPTIDSSLGKTSMTCGTQVVAYHGEAWVRGVARCEAKSGRCTLRARSDSDVAIWLAALRCLRDVASAPRKYPEGRARRRRATDGRGGRAA
jgi:hypothetical protein